MKLSEEIQEEIIDDAEFQSDLEKAMETEVSFRKDLTVLNNFITEKQFGIKVTKSLSVPVNNSESLVKLPKFEVKKFDGDATEWQSFIESFNAAIDKNSSLSDIQKMNYLLSFVIDEAAATVKGLQLSNANYPIAMKLLTERFGDPQVLISAHMSKLLSLEKIQSIYDIKGLRRVYDEVETQVRSLNCLGLEAANYGPMYIPVLFGKLPDELKLIISRQSGKNVWDIKIILNAFKTELEAREKISPSSECSENFDSPYSGSALFTSSGREHEKYNKQNGSEKFRKQEYRFDKRDNSQKQNEEFSCIFCGRKHRSKNCEIITKPETRKDILFKDRRCFICMKKGHISANCRNDMKCFKCKGRHHVAICTSKPSPTRRDSNPDNRSNDRDNSHANVVSNALLNVNKIDSILLQTARAKVCSTDEKECQNLRLLFDSGSQLSYISPRARNKLKLKTLGTKDMSLKTFGNMKDKKVFDRVNFAVKQMVILIFTNAFVSDICYPQVINIAQENYSHLRNLKLADSNPENLPMDIDILIGAQDYWNFIEQKTVRGTNGPTALASKLGYILSGPVESKLVKSVKSTSSNNNIVSTHFLKVEAEILEKTFVTHNDIKSCFETDSFWKNQVDDDEILEKFKRDTIFENDHYEVKLPFKEIHDDIGDNYVTSKCRLKSLMNKFKNNDELLIEYDRIIHEQKNLEIIEHAGDYKVNGTHYLPHRPVIREDKESTKVRMVFDASAKS